MDISLEKVDIVRDRTGVTYKEAREALEAANGNVVDALINIEESGNRKWTEAFSVKGNEAVDKVKNIVKSGNVNRIRVKKDDYVILDIPVTAGALSAVVIPQLTAVGTVIALLSKCTIEVERPNKETINVNNVISTTADDIAGKIKNAANEMRNTGNQATNQQTNFTQYVDPNASNTQGDLNNTVNYEPLNTTTDNNETC